MSWGRTSLAYEHGSVTKEGMKSLSLSLTLSTEYDGIDVNPNFLWTFGRTRGLSLFVARRLRIDI